MKKKSGSKVSRRTSQPAACPPTPPASGQPRPAPLETPPQPPRLTPSAVPMELASAILHSPGEAPGTPADATLAAAASSPELPIGECAALIGLDWGDEKHAIALQARGAHKVEKLVLPHSAESLHAWLDGLQARFGGQQVAVAVEATKGAVVSVLLEHPWLLIYPVHPTTSRRFSTAFTPSGAKDDAPDADVLLEILSLHRHRLRVLVPQDQETRYLGHLVELRRGLVDQRTQFSNELTSLLKNYFPQALTLIGDQPAAPLALAFLERWPELVELQRARPQTVRAFYYGQHVRRPELIEQRLELMRTARPLTQDRALCAASRLKLRALLALLRVLHAQIAELDQALHTTFADYPEAALLAELPGAGAALAPRLAVLFGRDRARWTSPEEMQKYYGIAPITKRSGQQISVHWRWNAPRFARQTLMEWTGLTVQYSRWAKAYYLQRKARGIGHAVILRALAFKWLRILWKCWQTGQPYDEARYLARLQQRNPALFALLPAA